MNLGKVNDIISRFVKDLTPEDLTVGLNFGQELFFDMAYKVKNEEVLRPFRIDMGDDNGPLTFTNGYAPKPAEFWREIVMSHFVNGKLREINIVNTAKYEKLIASNIEMPTARYAAANIQADRIRVMPKTLQYARFSYYKRPTWVVFGVDTTAGFNEYDPTKSTEFQWDDDSILQIIVIVLNNLGIQATKEQVEAKAK